MKGSANSIILAALAVIASLSLAACATPAKNISSLPLPADTTLSSTVEAQGYKLRPGDRLDVKFFYNPELNDEATIRPDGRISLQLVHEITAAGLTPAELTDLLMKKYASELAKPEITVIVRSFGGQMVFVDGEVNKPGMLNLVAPMTVMQAISEAGGVKDTAGTKEILIIRRGGDNKPIVLQMNMEKVLDGTETTQDVSLLPSDIVYVPKSGIANVNVWVDQYIRKNIPVNVGSGFYYNLTNQNL